MPVGDPVCDIDFDISNQDQYIVWAIGGLGETAFVHFVRSDRKSFFITFFWFFFCDVSGSHRIPILVCSLLKL